jgi:hypothetical protein
MSEFEQQPPPLPETGSPPAFPVPGPAAVPPRRAGAIVAAIAVIVIGGLGATLLVRSLTSKDTAKLEPGWKRVAVAAEGFNLGIPPGWKSVSTTSANQAFDALKSANPALANLVKDQLGGNLGSLIKMLAFDTKSPTLKQQFATNMNVVVAPAAGVDIDTFLAQNIGQLRQTPGLANIESRRFELPAGPAGLVTSRLTVNAPGGAQQVAITQYLVVSGTKGYILSFSTLPTSMPAYVDQFQQIAETFRFESS